MKLLGLLKSYLKDKTGIAAVEFALLFPPLVLMMVGAIDFGVYMNHKMKVENAARAAVDGLRYSYFLVVPDRALKVHIDS